MRCLAFDIETVPDTQLGAQLLGLTDITDEDIAKAMFFNQMQERGTDFLPLYQHRIVAIPIQVGPVSDSTVVAEKPSGPKDVEGVPIQTLPVRTTITPR